MCVSEDTVVAVSVTGILKVWIITADVSRMQVNSSTQPYMSINTFCTETPFRWTECVSHSVSCWRMKVCVSRRIWTLCLRKSRSPSTVRAARASRSARSHSSRCWWCVRSTGGWVCAIMRLWCASHHGLSYTDLCCRCLMRVISPCCARSRARTISRGSEDNSSLWIKS